MAGKAKIKSALTGYGFILPTFVFLIWFMYYPVYQALNGAFTDWDGFNAPNYIGLDNFTRMFSDEVLRQSVVNALIWIALSIVLAIVPPFFVAELIFHLKKERAQYIYRTLFVVPIVIPGIVTILLWRFLYQGDGALNQLLDIVGLGSLKQLWLGDPNIALYSIILMGFPWISAFNLLIFYSGLQSISSEVIEAAKLEGAIGWKRVRLIDIPLSAPQLRLIVILTLIGSLQNIIPPLIMTNGGPGYSTYVPILHMYNVSTVNGEFGYGMAIALVMFAVILLLTLINMKLIKSES
ncbi:sugar ABC transporter permease [Cohnella sp. LGH]|uniref:Raffinose/stachyose/melibiose transport system permease protein n=1 Tax=Cohnella phaseoli TaxID=456490 RepID=A0A3D9IJS3_9BACL|nr:MULTISPECIES: sugar ABC transporter permease [Cohnella]QTH43436.1 sugar ABC transporter permease [Cohnella sp. LGH]RED61897.1 raffinose/stachyose/melibiose transport system permease protein [Cohnella phaseoli]